MRGRGIGFGSVKALTSGERSVSGSHSHRLHPRSQSPALICWSLNGNERWMPSFGSHNCIRKKLRLQAQQAEPGELLHCWRNLKLCCLLRSAPLRALACFLLGSNLIITISCSVLTCGKKMWLFRTVAVVCGVQVFATTRSFVIKNFIHHRSGRK